MNLRLRINRSTLPIILTLLLGTSLSCLAAVAVAYWERANYRLQFQRQTDSMATAMQRSINRYTDLLLALGDFYTVAQQEVSRREFNAFVERALSTYPGIQALEWAPLVLNDGTKRDTPNTDLPTRSEFEAKIRAEGYPTFQITERESRGNLKRATSRPTYTPVTYLQPWAGNEPAFGYDLTSDPTRRQALETARDTGEIAASGRIRLVQENKNQFGFLVFLPLYDSPTIPGSQTTRRDRIRSYLLGVFRVSDVIEESLETFSGDIDFTIIDQTAAPTNQFLGRYESASHSILTDLAPQWAPPWILCPTPMACRHTLTTGGRQWAVTFAPASNYPAFAIWSALSTFVIGILLTLILAWYLAQSQAELARTRDLSHFKVRLFSMASHELRTPLSTILLSAQALEAETPDTAPLTHHHHRTFKRIRVAAKRMNQLLHDLLTLSRAESGKLQFSPEIIPLQQYCQQLIEEVQFSFDSHPEIAFTTSGHDLKAYVDPQLLRSILINLLSNAVKYSGPTPHVTLALTCHAHEIIFQIQDQGIGIPHQDQTHLYEAFYRATNVGDITGTGLGLSVVQACLQLHQGSLTCDSTVGEGTTFQVRLPRVE